MRWGVRQHGSRRICPRCWLHPVDQGFCCAVRTSQRSLVLLSSVVQRKANLDSGEPIVRMVRLSSPHKAVGGYVSPGQSTAVLR